MKSMNSRRPAVFFTPITTSALPWRMYCRQRASGQGRKASRNLARLATSRISSV